MKKIITLIAILLLNSVLFAQAVPQKMSYQAVIRNASNALLANQAVRLKVSILQGSATGTAVYVETQAATTSANGLVSIAIGDGTVVTGTLSTLDWSTGTYFIKTETDPTGGTNYTIVGTSQLLSVPYAMYAGSANGTLKSGTAAGNTPYWNGTTWVVSSNGLFNNGGTIGIGTTSPAAAAKLDVAGKIKITDGTQGLGKLLSSDASGLASWITNNFLTAEVDGSITNEIEMPTDVTKGDMSYYNGTVWTKITAPTTNGSILTYCEGKPIWTSNGECPIIIGSKVQGGVVYKIFQVGETGYVAGETHGMVASPTQGNSTYSASGTFINTLNAGTYNNWRLPVLDEITAIYTAVGNKQYFTYNYHWSSTASVGAAQWLKNPEDGNLTSQGWGQTFSVLAVRQF